MRDIKFRAWMKKQWMAHDVFPVGDTLAEMDDTPAMICLLKDVILMQYTGLKDKDGVEIYEGDVLRQLGSENETVAEGDVEWLDMSLSGWYIDGDINDSLGDINYNYDIEVIGNIHQNPELIGD